MATPTKWKKVTTLREIVDLLAHFNTDMHIVPVTVIYNPSTGDKSAYLEIKPSTEND